MKKINLIFFFALLSSPLFSQKSKIDSLQKILQVTKIDTARINVYIQIARFQNENDEYDLALKNCNKALQLFNRLPASLQKHKHSKKLKAILYNTLGSTYNNKGDQTKSLNYNLKAVKELEELNDLNGLIESYTNLGIFHAERGEFDRSLPYFKKVLQAEKDKKSESGIAAAYVNLGVLYFNMRETDSTIACYERSLAIYIRLNDTSGIATNYNNLTNVHMATGNIALAEQFNAKAIDLLEKINDKYGIAASRINLAILNINQKKYKEADINLQKGLKTALEIGHKEWIKNAYEVLATLNETTGDWKNAHAYHKLFVAYKDSIFNEENTKNMNELQTKYETEKKEKAIQILNKEKMIADQKNKLVKEQNQRQQFIIYVIIVGLILVFGFSIVLYKRWQLTKKQKTVIEKQKAEVDQAYAELEVKNIIIAEKNKEITDSINYAKRIQEAKLPPIDELTNHFEDSFIYFKPKDIVSGDFYFIQKKNQSLYFAAADCTGHGVPGALMSMIGMEKLTEAVLTENGPASILKSLNSGVKNSLRQNNELDSTRDGMDIALCEYNFSSKKLIYAGANRPMWIIRKNATEVEETKATKKAIGGITSYDQAFEQHEIDLHKGDTLYIFSDGYADQDGGDKAKKLMTKNFKKLLIDLQPLSLKAQKTELNQFIQSWMGDNEQIDDFLVIGVRI